MSPPPRDSHSTATRRFFLQRSGEPDFALRPEDQTQALRVLRLQAGDDLIGLDGRGTAYPLRVTRASKRELELEPSGSPRTEPPPGSGPESPRLELWVSPPKGGRFEELVGRATQLGVARIQPVQLERTPPHGAGSEGREGRLLRTAVEALKQSARLWMPEIGTQSLSLEDFLGASSGRPVWLDPAGSRTLGQCIEAGVDELHWRFLVGPEGGFSPAEQKRLEASHAPGARISAHTLRIETAGEASVAIAANRLLERIP